MRTQRQCLKSRSAVGAVPDPTAARSCSEGRGATRHVVPAGRVLQGFELSGSTKGCHMRNQITI